MRGWPVRRWIIIFHVAGRAFVKDAYTPSVRLETWASVPFAILPKAVEQIKKELQN
jgi:hypothetical protein